MRRIVTTLVGMALATTTSAASFEITGVIDEGQQPLVPRMMMANLTSKAGDVWDIKIDSPGGYVEVGKDIVKQITVAKQRGVAVSCSVGKMAASMAFVIFTSCSERRITKSGKLLTHSIATTLPGLFGVVINLQDAKALAKDLQKGQDELERIIYRGFNPPRHVFNYLSNHEVFFSGLDANIYVPGFITEITADPPAQPGDISDIIKQLFGRFKTQFSSRRK